MRQALMSGLMFLAPVTVGAAAVPTPCDTVLSIPYGTTEGALDTTRVDHDDPYSQLVTAYRVVESTGAPVIYLLPTGFEARLLRFREGRFEASVPCHARPVDFVIDGDGRLITVTPTFRNLRDAGFVNVETDGVVLRREVIPRATCPRGFEIGRFVRTGRGLLFVNPLSPAWLEIDPAREEGGMVIVQSLAAAGGDSALVTQEGPFIRRGAARALTLPGPHPGDVVASLPDGGFVVQHDWRDTDGWNGYVFDVYDRQAPPCRVRTVAAASPAASFGVGHPFYFTPDHVYQLVPGGDRACLLRY